MNFKLHKDFSEIDPAIWNALVEQSIADTPFSRYEYLNEWWKTLGGGEWGNARLVLVSASENDDLIGIAPLFIHEYDGQQALLFVGSVEISDYLDLIVREADLSRFLSGLIDFLASSLADTGERLTTVFVYVPHFSTHTISIKSLASGISAVSNVILPILLSMLFICLIIGGIIMRKENNRMISKSSPLFF